MSDRQGEVWWGPAPHKSDPAYRPWLIVSGDAHPFSAVECLVVGMTTTEHPDGIAVTDEDWIRGGSDVAAYVSPWYATTIKYRDFDDQQGELAPEVVRKTVDALHRYTPRPTEA
ncbi:hypothetical protein ACOZ35_13785 [Halorubrum xinjiangense]|uniref:hypothetical protein n=1 Tax=Halorubrum xinjiangense TaxID=261291 RepID=UPI003C704B61